MIVELAQSTNITQETAQQASEAITKAPQGEATGDEKLIESLRRINPIMAKHHPTWQDIDDVLEADLLRQSRQVDGIRTTVQIGELKGGGTKLFPFHKQSKETEFVHLPKGALEPWSEYAQRVRLTPFFPETPNIVDNRRGALFAKEPEIKASKAVMEFLDTIGVKRQSYREILDFLSWRTHAFSIVAVFIDFRKPPEDVKERQEKGEAVSEGEAEMRGLNQPVIATFHERQIYDFKFNRKDGRLDWIKLRTTFIDKTDWQDEGTPVEVFRIIDRTNVSMFEVRETDDGDTVETGTVTAHGAVNAAGDPEVPVVLVRPFMGKDDIGESPIKLSAAADLTAARLLSDIIWNLYIHGSPITIFTSPDTSGERASSLEWGTTHYVQLRSGNALTGVEGEEMSYLQLDPEGTRMLIEMFDKMVNKANEQANRTTPNAATAPVPMSGEAKRWDFKTGEEKALNEHIHAIQMASDEILKMLTRLLITKKVISGSIDAMEKEVRTSFDPSFEIGDADFNIEINEQVIAIAEKHKITSLMISALERISLSLHNLKDTERTAINKEIKALKKKLEDEEKEKPEKPVIPRPPAPIEKFEEAGALPPVNVPAAVGTGQPQPEPAGQGA